MHACIFSFVSGPQIGWNSDLSPYPPVVFHKGHFIHYFTITTRGLPQKRRHRKVDEKKKYIECLNDGPREYYEMLFDGTRDFKFDFR